MVDQKGRQWREAGDPSSWCGMERSTGRERVSFQGDETHAVCSHVLVLVLLVPFPRP